MIEYLGKGTLLGLAAGFSPGPLLVLVISETLRHSIKEGIKVSAAPLLTDIPILLASLFILSKLSAVDALLGILSMAGAGFIFFLGWEGLKIKPLNIDPSQAVSRAFRKGVVTNALNPHPYVFYMTVGGPIFLRALDQGTVSAAAFFGGFLFFLVGCKVLLALLTERSRSFLKGPVYLWIMRGLGAALIVFSATLIREGLRLLGLL